MTLHEKAEDLQRMILGGDILGGFEKYYAEDVVMQENQSEPRVGKATNRTYEEQFVNGLTAFRDGRVLATAVEATDDDNGTVFSEWFMDYSHSAFGDMKAAQVSVQRWKNGQVVSERFYHNAY